MVDLWNISLAIAEIMNIIQFFNFVFIDFVIYWRREDKTEESMGIVSLLAYLFEWEVKLPGRVI